MADVKKVRAVVVRGSYTPLGRDTVYPDDADPSVEVPEHHLRTFAGVLVPEAIAAQIRAEMAQNEKPLSPPTESDTNVVGRNPDELLASKEAAGERRRR